ncbi:MAG: threonine/serine dehydratase [Planctomycetaceae bacterium]|nr:threonine/serine dehydratase [Planctomycetaceae bacterium]
MSITVATIEDVRRAEAVIRQHLSPVPLIRSYRLEQELKLSPGRRVWLKDYGWTPVGSFKVLGALNWMAGNLDRIGDRPVAAHSSGNFASGISYAGMRYGKRVIIVMPESAPQVKFELTRSFGAEIRTYDITTDHQTGIRDRLTREIVEDLGGVQASPYDDNLVIAGNGVGGLEIVQELRQQGREVSHFFCPVSGGGLMAGHALAMADGFPKCQIVGVEPELADDFRQSLQAGRRVRVDQPTSICDGLLSYDVGEHNWPILQQHVRQSVSIPDVQTRRAMRWLYDNHGLRSEPSGAITLAALFSGQIRLDGAGDIVLTLSGRNADEARFREWTDLSL